MLLSTGEDADGSSQIQYFIREQLDCELYWNAGWISDEQYRTYVVEIFKETTPFACFIDIHEEYFKWNFILNRRRAIDAMKQ
eukprot:IDg1822t1